MNVSRLARRVLAGGLAVVIMTSPVSAKPPVGSSRETSAFRANVRLRAAFLVSASEMAKTHSTNGAVRTFAAADGVDQAGVLDAFETNEANGSQTRADTAPSGVLTGRSAAAIQWDEISNGSLDAGVMMPAAAVSLSHLDATQGPAFDSLYISLAHTVLGDLAALYQAYAFTGDDAVQRSIAVAEYAKVEAALSLLQAMKVQR